MGSIRSASFAVIAAGTFTSAISSEEPPSGPNEQQALTKQALLAEDKGERFSVFMLDLSTREFTKTPAKAEEHKQVGYEAANLDEFARARPAA